MSVLSYGILRGISSIALILAAPLSAASAQADPANPDIFRNCVSGQEVGQHPPPRAEATYLYVFNVIVHHDVERGSNDVGWVVAGSLEEACRKALAKAAEWYPPDQGWSVGSGGVLLVPDSVLRQGLAH